MHKRVKIDLPSGAISGVYVIRNVKNGKRYVGSAVNIRARWYGHRFHLRKGTSKSSKLQKAWNSYGEASFKFEMLEVVQDGSFLIEREQFWMDQLQTIAAGMNVLGANEVHNQAARSKMRQASLGKKASEETRAKMSASQKGRKVSAEGRANMSKARMGKPLSEAHRQKCRLGRLGKPLSRELVDLLAAHNRGKSRSLEVRQKISAKLMGHSVSAETRQKIRETKLGRLADA